MPQSLKCVCVCVYFTTISKGAAEGEIIFGPDPVPCASQDFLLWELPELCVWGGCGWCILSEETNAEFAKSAQFQGVNNRRHWQSAF